MPKIEKTEDIPPQGMQVLGELVNSVLPPTIGFALFIFDLNAQGLTQVKYISNAQREDMRAAIQSMLTRWELDQE